MGTDKKNKPFPILNKYIPGDTKNIFTILHVFFSLFEGLISQQTNCIYPRYTINKFPAPNALAAKWNYANLENVVDEVRTIAVLNENFPNSCGIWKFIPFIPLIDFTE
ncbi:hypothetical protein CEXT_500161 [Caerostris extrusa]|uniref:Uncharacterized protein n=1 Tax=Caerostris extrusa TaxID=172846 RepID=A0AAV4N804_CAEEX|nr:hypothetical protein CEXT_500161 [Caerostris extrusa]